MPRHARGWPAAALLTTALVAVPPTAAGAAEDAPLIGRGAPGLGAVAPGALPGAQIKPADRAPAADQYIVQLDAPPLARYQGGATGFARPRRLPPAPSWTAPRRPLAPGHASSTTARTRCSPRPLPG